MKNYKRILAAGVSCILAASMLAGCGDEKTKSDSKTDAKTSAEEKVEASQAAKDRLNEVKDIVKSEELSGSVVLTYDSAEADTKSNLTDLITALSSGSSNGDIDFDLKIEFSKGKDSQQYTISLSDEVLLEYAEVGGQGYANLNALTAMGAGNGFDKIKLEKEENDALKAQIEQLMEQATESKTDSDDSEGVVIVEEDKQQTSEADTENSSDDKNSDEIANKLFEKAKYDGDNIVITIDEATINELKDKLPSQASGIIDSAATDSNGNKMAIPEAVLTISGDKNSQSYSVSMKDDSASLAVKFDISNKAKDVNADNYNDAKTFKEITGMSLTDYAQSLVESMTGSVNGIDVSDQ